EGAVLNDPKGLAIFDRRLWICDNKRCLTVPLDRSRPPEVIDLGTTAGLGDPFAWGGHLYIGYGDEETILKVAPGGEVTKLRAVGSINGLAERGGRLFCVTWATHEVYELDPEGEDEPIAFGLAEHFKNLDGIEVLADGTFIVSDFAADRLYTIAPDRRTVKVLAEVSSPADILVDHERMLLYVPSYFGGKATIYKLVSE
ncbi:MAG: SMP-30/gluconolactonase/LRE family protein, partial [Planctomycetota bacterium]